MSSPQLDLNLPAIIDITRFRPQNALEIRENGEIIVAFDENQQNVKVKTAGVAEKDGFNFDRVFPMETKQYEVFEYGVQG